MITLGTFCVRQVHPSNLPTLLRTAPNQTYRTLVWSLVYFWNFYKSVEMQNMNRNA